MEQEEGGREMGRAVRGSVWWGGRAEREGKDLSAGKKGARGGGGQMFRNFVLLRRLRRGRLFARRRRQMQGSWPQKVLGL
jgi:hypothetical protein